jgi:AmpD protein
MQAWSEITPDRITGHSDIAPGRKTDPGPAFDWNRVRAELA